MGAYTVVLLRVRPTGFRRPAMLGHPPEDPLSIFVNGKLKPGTYNVQNLVGQTYLEVLEHSRELCCRPSTALSQQDGLVCLVLYNRLAPPMLTVFFFQQWEFKVSGSGYTIKKGRGYIVRP